MACGSSQARGRIRAAAAEVLRNKLARKFVKLEKEGASVEELEALGVGGLKKAAIDGDVDNGSVMAGQIAGMINKEQTAKEIIEELFKEADERFNLCGGRYE